MITLGRLRATLRADAVERGINPRDIDLLLGHALSRPLTWLIAHDDETLSSAEHSAIELLVARRNGGEPVQYLRGFCEFYGRSFRSDARALIPRPETELLVEHAVETARRESRVIDVGTGSGCIAITLKLERPDLHVVATDIELSTLQLACENATLLGAELRLVAADVLAPFAGQFDLIISNPPYIPESEIESLAREVRDFEPKRALTPGASGLEVIDRLFADAQRLLAEEGRLLFEIGYGQSEQVRERAAVAGFRIEAILNDLAAIPRVVISSRR